MAFVGNRRALLTQGFLPQSLALFARFTTAPTPARKVLINNLIKSLLLAGVWQRLDCLYVTAAADAQAARRNWIADQYNLIAVSSPTFVADRGYTGDGSTSYLNTGFTPSTAIEPRFVLNSAHQGIWSRTDLPGGGSSSFDFGDNARASISRSTTVGQSAGRTNISTLNPVQATGAYPGHAVWARSSDSLWEGYAQGIDAGGGTNLSTAVSTVDFRMCAQGTAGFGVNQIAAAHFGGNLTAAEVLTLYNAIRTYLQAVGAA